MLPPILRRLFTTPLGLFLLVAATLSLVSIANFHPRSREVIASTVPISWLGTGYSGAVQAGAEAKAKGELTVAFALSGSLGEPAGESDSEHR